MDLRWWFFAIPGCISVAIALLTLSHQTIKMAITNPVKFLKDE